MKIPGIANEKAYLELRCKIQLLNQSKSHDVLISKQLGPYMPESVRGKLDKWKQAAPEVYSY